MTAWTKERTVAGRFVLERRLGAGGMGETWLAKDASLGRKVALKIAREGWGFGPQEAQAIARLEHPNIVRLYDLLEDDGQVMVMEYVPGESLRDRMQRGGALQPVEAAAIAGEIATGLAYAHDHGVLHNDVKPENILIRDDGVAKLADFGAAVSEQATAPLAANGVMFGTVRYVAPEVLAGAQRTRQSDIFALGVVLRDALSSQTATPEALAERAGPRLTAAIERATSPNPTGRYESAAAFADALAPRNETARIEPSILPPIVAAAPRRPHRPPRLHVGRPPAAVLLGVAAAGLLGIVSAGFALGGGTGSSQLPDGRVARDGALAGGASSTAEAASTPTPQAVVVEERQPATPPQQAQNDKDKDNRGRGDDKDED